MNRSAIKTFATQARRALLEQVRARAAQFGIDANGVGVSSFVSGGMIVNGQTLNADETAQYLALRSHLEELQRSEGNQTAAVNALVNEVAYTWFNRLTALRFMEVHDYLPCRALTSSDPNLTDPDLLRDATALVQNAELDGLNLERLDEWRRLYDSEGVYRRLLVAQCDTLAVGLPFLFSASLSYTSLFLPANLLHSESLIRKLERDIPESDWQDIEIVGWLYQFYISDEKDRVIGGKGKYPARDIPAATQLFTPHWIVRYMVENSVGRLWLEAHPASNLRAHMPYYLESPAENPKPSPNPALRPEDLSVLDPACGSGHILVYAFDLLFEIYSERGYAEREIPQLILTHNLHGLDIDERAAQLASFAVTMKARAKNRRILREPPKLNILAVKATRHVKLEFPKLPTQQHNMFEPKASAPAPLWTQTILPRDWQPLLEAFRDADNLGSLIAPPAFDDTLLESQVNALESEGGLFAVQLAPELRHTLEQARLLRKTYQAVIANPPYMRGDRFNTDLKTFVGKRYPRSKNDLFAVFMERTLEMTSTQGRMATINQQSWMFLSDYEKMRKDVLAKYTIESMVHLGARAFPEIGGEVVQSTAFVIDHETPKDQKGVYIRLVDIKDSDEKAQVFLAEKDRIGARVFHANAREFEKIPGSPLGYWANSNVIGIFETYSPLEVYGNPRQGMTTSNNDEYLRLWHEVSFKTIGLNIETLDAASKSSCTWFPYNKGGEFRKWYGNHDFIVNYGENGKKMKNFHAILNITSAGGRIKNQEFYFQESVSWSKVSSGDLSVRYFPSGFIFDVAGSSIFTASKVNLENICLILNSVTSKLFVDILSPTLNYEAEHIRKIPLIAASMGLASSIYSGVVSLSKTDWDNFETSWDFQTHPLLRHRHTRASDAYRDWETQSETAFQELKRLEEENNRYWIHAYGLQDELTPEVPDKEITIRRANPTRDAKSLISYAVGCMMGRYSLDAPGLIHAGQPFDPGRHGTFPADLDGIIPITDEVYFDDDAASRFTVFLKTAFGPEHLQENLEWIADALERKRDETPSARIRRYFLTEFVSDHIQTYKKRPIYWVFTSGKKRAFNAIVYLHRYQPDSLARMRTDYVLELQTKLDGTLERLGSGREVPKVRDQIAELRVFQERLQHKADQRVALDLDDGVAFNYTLFEGLVYEGADLKMADLLKRSQWKRDLLAGKVGKGSSKTVSEEDSDLEGESE